MKSIRNLLISVALGMLGMTCAQAQVYTTTYYFSDCDTSAPTLGSPDANCVPGDNANAGTSANAPKRDFTGFSFATLPACSRVLLAKGGMWLNKQINLGGNNSTKACPLLLDSYTPPWATGDEAAPLLAANSGTIYPIRGSASSPRCDLDGYVVRNLQMRGTRSVIGGVETPATSSFGIFMQGGNCNWTIEDNDIRGFGIAIEMSTSGARGKGSIIRRNNVQDNGQGIHGNCVQTRIEDNDVHDNATDATDAGTLNHNLYLGEAKNCVVRNNIVWNNSVQQSTGQCTSVQFVVHGQIEGLLIEGNTFSESNPAPGCYAIAVDPGYASKEYFRNVVIRGNNIINFGGLGIGVTACQGCAIYNNKLVKLIGDGIGIGSPSNALQLGATLGSLTNFPDDAGMPQTDIFNNTIYFGASTNQNSTGIQYQHSDVNGGNGNGTRIAGNVVYFGGTSAGIGYCFKLGTAPDSTKFPLVASNTCYHVAGTARWSDLYIDLTAAQTAGFGTGDAFGVNPQMTIPTSGNSYDVTPLSGSPLLGAANATLKSSYGYGGRVPTTSRDRGSAQRDYTAIKPYPPVIRRPGQSDKQPQITTY